MEEKMVKFDAQTFFEELKQLNYEEIRELYKGLIAYQTGQEVYNEAVDKAAEVALEYYYECDSVSFLIDESVVDVFENTLLGDEEEC